MFNPVPPCVPQVATQLLAPICPHTCEHIWGNLLKKEGMVITGERASYLSSSLSAPRLPTSVS